MPATTKLYLPVENIELLSRYGSDGGDVELDKLGGVAWQAKQGAAQEAHPRHGGAAHQDRGAAPAGEGRPDRHRRPALYDEFAARFPYDETEDQLTAIAPCSTI